MRTDRYLDLWTCTGNEDYFFFYLGSVCALAAGSILLWRLRTSHCLSGSFLKLGLEAAAESLPSPLPQSPVLLEDTTRMFSHPCGCLYQETQSAL